MQKLIVKKTFDQTLHVLFAVVSHRTKLEWTYLVTRLTLGEVLLDDEKRALSRLLTKCNSSELSSTVALKSSKPPTITSLLTSLFCSTSAMPHELTPRRHSKKKFHTQNVKERKSAFLYGTTSSKGERERALFNRSCRH